jgi:N-glycosylase/DNA lyase
MRLPKSCPFNLNVTLCCGQVFRWANKDEWWYGITRDNAFKIKQLDDELHFENVDTGFVKDYFGLNDDLVRILSEINKDGHINKAVHKLAGLRILHQDPWECLISYICATYKNIPAIKHMLLNLSRRMGEEILLDDERFYTFPTSSKLAKANIRDLTDCGLGYRARYVAETARMIHERVINIDELQEMTYDEAKKELLKLPGVGLKVADCVLLFSLRKLEAFPIDVWMRRALIRNYSNRFSKDFVKRISTEKSFSNSEYGKLNTFGREYFGRYAGYAQEYLFHYERMERNALF